MKRLIVALALFVGSVTVAAQTRVFGPEVTAALAALGYVTNTPTFVQYSKSFLLPYNGYLNFNTISGTSGYGLRDNAGAIQIKDSGGSWITLSTFNGNVSTDVNLTANAIPIGANGVHKIKPSVVSIDASGNLSGLGTLTPLTIYANTDTPARTLHIIDSSTFTINRTLNFITGDADRAITLSGDPTLADWFNQSVKSTASPTFNVLTLTSLLTTNLTVSAHVVTVTGATTLDDWFNQSVKTSASPAFTGLSVNSHVITVNGIATLNDWFNQSVKTSASPAFAGLTVNTFALTVNGAPTLNDWFDQSVKTTAGPSFGGLFTVGRSVTNDMAIQASLGTGVAATNGVVRAQAYSPSFELFSRDGSQNWNFGLADDDGKALYIGRGYGPTQGITPALKFTTSDVATFASTVAEQGRAFPMGGTQSVAYAGGNFTGSGSITWTVASGDQVAYTYRLVGDTMWVNFDIATTTVSGTGTTLLIAVPGGKTIAEPAFLQPCAVGDNSATFAMGLAFSSSSTKIGIAKADFSNWSAATDTTAVSCQIHFKVS